MIKHKQGKDGWSFIIAVLIVGFIGGISLASSLGCVSGEEQNTEEKAMFEATGAKAKTDDLVDRMSMAFETASSRVSPSVVSIIAEQEVQIRRFGFPDDAFRDFFGEDFFERFFGVPQPPQNEKRTIRSLGSGVIVTEDGFILTNNHVIEKAEKLLVLIGDDKRYEAEVVGSDPPTDVAVIKIEDGTQIKNMVAQTDPGTSVKTIIIRDGQKKEVTLKLTERQEDERQDTKKKAPEGKSSSRNLGLVIQTLTPDIAHQLGFENEKGVVITQVFAGSPASEAGLRRGDLIQEVNRRAIESETEFEGAIETLKSGDVLALLVRRGQNTFFVTIEVPEE